MGEATGITWAHDTFNPWWGCVRVSPGCEHCYAEAFDWRMHARSGAHWGPTAPRRMASEAHWRLPLRWNAEAEKNGTRRRVFCASMADVFEIRADQVGEQLDAARARLWALIEVTPSLDWLLLTKRPENIEQCVPAAWLRDGFPRNVWLGITAEDQERLELRMLRLEKVASLVNVLWISYEPAIGPLKLGRLARRIDWLVCGGESGHGARPFDLGWARAVRDELDTACVPFFMKQGGAANACEHSSKGEHFECLPGDLRIREFPNVDGDVVEDE